MHSLATIHPAGLRRILICSFFILFQFNSCKLASDFPLTIDDIDTLSVYKTRPQDSTAGSDSKAAAIAHTTVLNKDTADLNLQSNEPSKTLRPWTICVGVFKKKKNAKRMFEHLNHYNSTHIILRDSIYVVAIGSFATRDSAQQFRTSKALTGTYIIKLRQNEQLINITE